VKRNPCWYEAAEEVCVDIFIWGANQNNVRVSSLGSVGLCLYEKQLILAYEIWCFHGGKGVHSGLWGWDAM
jgi:hypothetical protein